MDALANLLRPYLQPLTLALPQPVRNLGLNLLGPSCYSSLIEQINPTAGCLKLSISKALGIGIISASSIVKIPQIKNLLASRSARGVSFLAYVLETSALLVGLAYNTRMGFPLSTFGESALIAVQNVVIAVLVLRFGGWSDALVVGFLAVGAGVAWGLFSEVFVDVGMLARVMAGAGVVGVLSKVPQIWTVWKEGGTGQLSAFAVFNYLAGSLARVFTTLQEVDDKLILYGFVAGFALNAVLAAQMVYYWNSSTEVVVEKKKQEKDVGALREKIAVGDSSGVQTKVKSPTTRRRG